MSKGVGEAVVDAESRFGKDRKHTVYFLFFYRPQRSWGQGNIFRSVCQEFCSHLGAVHAGRYGQKAGGTHPTGMHTCLVLLLQDRGDHNPLLGRHIIVQCSVGSNVEL